MSYTTTPRDPGDQGIHRTPPRVRTGDSRAARPAPTQLTEGRVAVAESAPVTTLYGLNGGAVSDVAIAAARVDADPETGRTAYSIRVSAYGPDRGRFLDPLGFYHRPEDMLGFDSRSGRARFEFREVPEGPFRDYLHYLMHRTTEFLRRAERAVLNG